jgi:AraC-like DNA-binding protein
MKLYIKNMVSPRCISAVTAEMEKLNIHCLSVKLGEVEVDGSISETKLEHLASSLRMAGLEILEDKQIILVEKVRNLIIEIIHGSNEMPKTNISDYISDKLHCSYSHLSHLFSAIRHTTIEQYIILQKIERVKELITYNELSLSEIAFKMNYSSVQHLSNQFKKITSTTPTQYKNADSNTRISLNSL